MLGVKLADKNVLQIFYSYLLYSIGMVPVRGSHFRFLFIFKYGSDFKNFLTRDPVPS